MGVCTICGKKIKTNSGICSVCMKRENKEYYRSIGLCPYCHKNNIFPGEKSCPECKVKMAIRSQTSRDRNREHYNRLVASSHKKTYDRRKMLGICTRCGKRKADAGQFRCGVCRAKTKVENKKCDYIPRSERVANGLCYFCGEPLDREGRCCTKCAERNAVNASKIDRTKHSWRNQDKLIKKE